ncbi:MAG: type II toxin-antitoxin system VapC family toxin [Mycobacteriaceae bacterium]|uniref:type II toxin-antitoxin system VapC family toxin n=1 Tax=Corynebacterium sp. TaxID=1720 RepID=UPI003F98EE8E
MRLVVDASALVDALTPTLRHNTALDALQGFELWAPHIVDVEVSSAIWRMQRMGLISNVEADNAMRGFQDAPIKRLSHPALLPETWSLRHSLRISDAFYVAASRLLDAGLLTSDARLSRAPSLGVTVTLLR